MNNPLITVITSVYNSESTIEKTILSVLNQSYRNIQFVIIDGGSQDSTVKIIEKYSSKIDYWSSEPDSGIYDAWNKGLKVSKGDWISFLGADDEYLPDAIENYAKFIDNNSLKTADLISSKINLVDKYGNFLRTVGKSWDWANFRVYMTIAHVGALHNKTFFNKYGLYNLKYKITGDYELLLRAGKDLKAAFMDKITVNMQIGGQSNNNLNSFIETLNSKVDTGARTYYQAYGDMLIARLKYWIRTNMVRFN